MAEANTARQSWLGASKRTVMDGWFNVITGLGTLQKDKRLGAEVEYSGLKEKEVEQLYAADDVAASLVDILPEDAVREWIKFEFDTELGKAIEDYLDDLKLSENLEVGWKWGRLYGGSAILINIDDSQDLSLPLDLNRIRQIFSFVPLTRYELKPVKIEDDLTSHNFGKPILYEFNSRRNVISGKGSKNRLIHHTRLIRFDGVQLPLGLHIANQHWGDSVLTRTYNAIRNYNTSNDAVATVLQEFNTGVLKIKNLAEMLAQGENASVQQRFEIISLAKSVCRAIVIDGESESYDNISASVSGIPDMLRTISQRLVVASRMPHTKILGESPSGLGATGESEIREWYDFVSRQQELILRPKIHKVLQIVFAARQGPSSGKEPETWSFEFSPLWQKSDKELAEIRKMQAETDEIYIRSQVVDPDEVAISRFGSNKYSVDTTIDIEAREAMSSETPSLEPSSSPAGTENPSVPGGSTKPIATAASQNQLTTPTQSLNGAQVTSLIDIVQRVALNQIPRETGIAIIRVAFALSEKDAESIMGNVGSGFKPAEVVKPTEPKATI
jgi:phage-related protein (TIGR01555 family)